MKKYLMILGLAATILGINLPGSSYAQSQGDIGQNILYANAQAHLNAARNLRTGQEEISLNILCSQNSDLEVCRDYVQRLKTEKNIIQSEADSRLNAIRNFPAGEEEEGRTAVLSDEARHDLIFSGIAQEGSLDQCIQECNENYTSEARVQQCTTNCKIAHWR